MAGMGPPPKPNARRRNTGPATLKLPAEGRKGQVPAFPLPTYTHPLREFARAVHSREVALWRELWKKPQAVAWDRLKMHAEVGLHCRFRVLAELGDMKAAAESRQIGDRLGMTPMALLRLRWEIVVDEVAEQRVERTKAAKTATAAKTTGARRLKAVDGGAVARS